LTAPAYTKIAIALDFSENDQKLLSHALGQGNNNTTYVLVHIVESVPARIYENESDDLETEKDKEHIEFYAQQLRERGFNAEAKVGFGSRTKEIVRIVRDAGADMLVIGAHRHTGIKDFFYGETINPVRHELKIPVLVVSL
jgi:manganese transport protein